MKSKAPDRRPFFVGAVTYMGDTNSMEFTNLLGLVSCLVLQFHTNVWILVRMLALMSFVSVCFFENASFSRKCMAS